jgi:hypothetical protein
MHCAGIHHPERIRAVESMKERNSDVALSPHLPAREQGYKLATRLQDARYFAQTAFKICNVLQHLIANDGVKHIIGIRKATVADSLNPVAEQSGCGGVVQVTSTFIEDVGTMRVESQAQEIHNDVPGATSEIKNSSVSGQAKMRHEFSHESMIRFP